jgi:hypothetical protein
MFLIASCSSSKKTVLSNSANTIQSVSNEGRDGSSIEKAIIIKAKSDMAGVDEEYAWLRKNYPGYKSNGQALLNKNKKPYDKISITTADGDKKDIYFDITNSFGKF